MKLDFIFHGGGNLNAKMHLTAGFDDACRKAFEHWHLLIGGNAFLKEDRFLDMPVTEDARLAIRTFGVKQAGARAEGFFLGVRLTRDSYREAGEYYRLVAALRALSIDCVNEFVSSEQPLDLKLTMPMRRQSMWKPFSELSGTRVIGSEKFDEKLEDVLLAVSVSNIDDWFGRMFLAIDPAFDRQEFNLVVSKTKPKMGSGVCGSPVVTSAPDPADRTSAGSCKSFFAGLACGGIGVALIGALCFESDKGNYSDDGYKRGFELEYKKECADSRNCSPSNGERPSRLTKAQETCASVMTNVYSGVTNGYNKMKNLLGSGSGTNDVHATGADISKCEKRK